MICPCKDCLDRTVTCHGVCQRYAEWKKEREQVSKWLRDQKPVTSEAGLKEINRQLKHGKSRKWNLKQRYRRDES